MSISPDESGEPGDEMRSEYDFRKLHGIIRGKYSFNRVGNAPRFVFQIEQSRPAGHAVKPG